MVKNFNTTTFRNRRPARTPHQRYHLHAVCSSLSLSSAAVTVVDVSLRWVVALSDALAGVPSVLRKLYHIIILSCLFHAISWFRTESFEH